jgi:CRP/FNR family transcriptional regulator, cyclic AMP receptor protein
MDMTLARKVRRLAPVRLGRDAKTDLIKSVPLFSHCSRGQLTEIAGIADEIDLPEGKELMTQGDRGREFFILLDGTAEVTQDGQQINELGTGDFFGEIALVWQAPRTATVKTTSPARALVITDRSFRALLDHQPEIKQGVLEALAARLAPQTL